MNEKVAPRSLTDIPETDDPVVLRELLRQSREHLRMRESIEQMMAESVARTEAMLVENRASERVTEGIDPAELKVAIDGLRTSLQEALSAVDRLDALLPAEAVPEGVERVELSSAAETPEGPRTIEVLMQEVTSPSVARSLQQYLANLEQVTRADVRELAEGLLRITVHASAPLTGATLAAWEPERDRTVRTERADVLEIELES